MANCLDTSKMWWPHTIWGSMYILHTGNFERLVLPITVRVMMAPYVIVDAYLKGIGWAKLVAEQKALNNGD